MSAFTTQDFEWSVAPDGASTQDFEWSVIPDGASTQDFEWSVIRNLVSTRDFEWSSVADGISLQDFEWSVVRDAFEASDFEWSTIRPSASAPSGDVTILPVWDALDPQEHHALAEPVPDAAQAPAPDGEVVVSALGPSWGPSSPGTDGWIA